MVSLSKVIGQLRSVGGFLISVAFVVIRGDTVQYMSW